jgi:hypothetical protein
LKLPCNCCSSCVNNGACPLQARGKAVIQK